MNEFLVNFADIFDETPIDELTPTTIFKDLMEWSSLHALATINMVEINYSVLLKASDIIEAKSIQDLYDLILASK
jgi:acyl carrier protein